jgi:hypothetical protein
MDALDILKAARAKIADPKDWGKGRRRESRPLHTCCAAEAIEEVSLDLLERERAFRALKNAAGIDADIIGWNDHLERTHSEVRAAFDLAIATLRLR